MLHESRSLLEQKYQILGKCIKQQQALLGLVRPDCVRDVQEISEQNYARHLDAAIKDALTLIVLFSTQNQVDPAVLKQNQLVVLSELKRLASEELDIINSMQVYTESRISNDNQYVAACLPKTYALFTQYIARVQQELD